MKKTFFIAFALLGAMATEAKVQLPRLFQDGMVLQREKPIPVWGQADAGEHVSVELVGKRRIAFAETTADAEGNWALTLPQQKAGGPYLLKVGDTTLRDCLIGDVWLCSGQSNIDVTVERVYPQYGSVIDDYQNPQIRMFRVQTDTDTHGPKSDVKPTPINWKPVTKDNAWLFSAVGYFLGREMYEKTRVPQGIIVNSLGGTPIQAWLAADTLRQHFPDELQRTLFYQDDEMVKAMLRANQLSNAQWERVMNENDPILAALSKDNTQHKASLSDATPWQTKHQYDNLTGQHQYRGSFWARQTVSIDAAHTGQPARLLVGTLYDADFTYMNGQQVGHTGYQYPPRRYQIPAGVLREGDNTLAVRFITKGGNPHFIKDKPYKLIFEDGLEVPLSTEWEVHPGAQMPACPQTDINIQNLPTVLYNAMLCPLAPYALQGVVWYQGESNTGGDAWHYETYLTELISGWRQLFQQPDLPFMVVQLANFMEPSDSPQETNWAVVREAQRQVAAKMNNTELACIIDLGETVDIHPLRKREVAQRIAMGFDHILWNKKQPLSPQVVSSAVNDRQILLTLDQPLREGGRLCEFEVAGEDGRFQNAEATADGRRVVIASPIDQPRRVRYAWKNNPQRANAYGKNGLPMSPFQLTIDAQ